jgi:hypothetical protein
MDASNWKKFPISQAEMGNFYPDDLFPFFVGKRYSRQPVKYRRIRSKAKEAA